MRRGNLPLHPGILHRGRPGNDAPGGARSTCGRLHRADRSARGEGRPQGRVSTTRQRCDHCGHRFGGHGGARLADRCAGLRATAVGEGHGHAPTAAPSTRCREPKPALEPECGIALAPGDCGRSPPGPPTGPPRSSCEACPRPAPVGTEATPLRPRAQRSGHGCQIVVVLAAVHQYRRDRHGGVTSSGGGGLPTERRPADGCSSRCSGERDRSGASERDPCGPDGSPRDRSPTAVMRGSWLLPDVALCECRVGDARERSVPA